MIKTRYLIIYKMQRVRAGAILRKKIKATHMTCYIHLTPYRLALPRQRGSASLYGVRAQGETP